MCCIRFGNCYYIGDIINCPCKLKDVKLTLKINEPENFAFIATSHLNDLSALNPGQKLFGSAYDMRVYKGLSIQVGTISFRLLNDVTQLSFTSSIYADNMEPMVDKFILQIGNGGIQYFLQ